MTMKNVVKRNGEFQEFDMMKIKAAVIKAAIQDGKYDDEYANTIGEFVMNDTVAIIGDDVDSITVEDIQDLVEEILMEYNKQIAKTYIIYRNDHAQKRKNKSIAEFNTLANNKFSFQYYVSVLLNEYADLHDHIFETGVKVWSTTIDKNNTIQMLNLLIIELRSQIQYEPKYSNVCADILNDIIFLENFNTVYKELPNEKDATSPMPIELFLLLDSLEYGMRVNRISRNVINAYTGADLYDIALHAINSIKRGDKTLIGIQTLYDRYLLHDNDNHYESVHGMFVRVALGLGHTEEQETRIEKTKAFFDLMYSTLYMPSTPTLFNSGTIRPQLSSCYLTTIPDDLLGIYEGITDDAMLSKYAGGIGNDWTQVRGLGSHIAGTNGKSQGVIPFMKVVNDTAVAVNQGGKRRGAICSYLETWHIDIEDFLDLRKNTGDERRRTHDMNTANWIPDLFMERVLADETWTLFSPDETPDLHDLIGIKFKVRYEVYEQMARDGTIKLFKTVSAKTLWRKMLTMLFETGHPWVTFKDAFNTRYSNQHVGVIHSSNLCTEIGLHTNADEIAVCNLGSVNVTKFVTGYFTLDEKLIEKTVTTAVRMLDNVIDYNYYSVDKAFTSNNQHRPIGLGILGFQDALYMLGIPYDSPEAVDFADYLQEVISYYAISASCDLARERGAYSTFEGSLWSKGILPIDSLQMLASSRADGLLVSNSCRMPMAMWDDLRDRVKKYGMRNSNVMAIAPTATISNICGVSQSIEPTYQNVYVKSNLSGEFITINTFLVDELKKLGLWNNSIARQIINKDGSVQDIHGIPTHIKALFKTAFEIDSVWLINAASRRQKWIDQGQSLNLYMKNPSGKKLNDLYTMAWMSGLKSTYYLRTMAATGNEKTIDESDAIDVTPATDIKFCSIDNPDCEACS